MTPYELVYGQLPPSPISYIPRCSKVQAIDQIIYKHATMIAHLKDNLHQVQNLMKQQADQHHFEHTFQEGDKCIGAVAYKLALPPTSKIHPDFHVSCPKKVVGNNFRIQTILPKLDEEGSLWIQPEHTTDTHERHLYSRTIKEFLVKWKETSREDVTWEPSTILQHFFQCHR
eukprot:PITA_05793